MVERGRIALREVQFWLNNCGSEAPRNWHWTQTRGCAGRLRVAARISAHFRCVRVHMVVDVLFHLGLGRKTPSAVRHRATKRPIALVSTRVLVQDRLLTEVFAALLALVRFLAGVDTQMLIEDRALAEVATAVHTTVRLLVCVDAQVLRKMGLLSEPLAALRARVWSRFDVYATVL